ncbi:hypothetical protein ONZ43_g60 [Nemania bipapillata]|uniref:Uncharacterized protein n=1 Tax=Nemania bipapillata TaxID=110536 RepID=A0ACC2J9H2_9PEZI|nr:hypothetical protein ONZ43_g60 [Nemania bipapillata]
MAAQDQNGLEDIPPLTSISPSIFVLTDRDFTKTPPPMSDDPITRLETTIDALDWHAARVEENMIAMFALEAERVQRAGQVERVQYDAYLRPIKDQQRNMDNELRLEEMILREDEDAVRKILIDGRHRDNEDTSSSREDPRERRPHHRSHSPPPFSPRSRGPRDLEYMDLATVRREKMFRQDVNELRQTPRSAALTHVLNLVKWGWDEQIEGHRAAIKKEKEERRANLHRQMKENPIPLATTGPSVSTPTVPASTRKNSVDGDAMDID